MRIVFMGTPDFAVPALDSLVSAGHDIVAVYTQPPRPAGRGKRDRPSPVHARAEVLGLPVHTPKSLKSGDAQAAFQAHGADVAVVAAYGLILPPGILDAPRLGCLNIHASLLPRWRGAAPIQRAIMAGDDITGVCIMQMESGLDTGPVLSSETIPITRSDTGGSVHDRLSELGARLIVNALENMPLAPHPQPETGVTYAAKIDKAETRIDWSRPAAEVDRHIRALSPFPGAWFEMNGERIKVLLCSVADGDGYGPPGLVAADLRVTCGNGAIELIRLQRAGRRAQDRADFLRGFALPTGTRLG